MLMAQRTAVARWIMWGLLALQGLLLAACNTIPQQSASGQTPPPGQGTVWVRVTANGLPKMFKFHLEARPQGSQITRAGLFFVGWGPQSDGYWTVVDDHLDKGQLVGLQVPAGACGRCRAGLRAGPGGVCG